MRLTPLLIDCSNQPDFRRSRMEYGAHYISCMDSGRVQLLIYHTFFQSNGCILNFWSLFVYVWAYLGNIAWMGNCFLVLLAIGKGYSHRHVSMLRIHNVYFVLYYVHCSSAMSQRWDLGLHALACCSLPYITPHQPSSGFLIHELLKWKPPYLIKFILAPYY